MTKTVEGLLNHCKVALAQNWKYVYGAKGTVLTRTQIQSLKNRYGSLVWNSDLNKAGSICCDCSGLISSYTGVIRSSSNYKSTATAIATIAQLRANWKAYVGWGIWLNGHIGVVSDTVGYHYAMDGSARNMVHYPISKNSWMYVIKLCDIDYSSLPSSAQDTTTKSNVSLSDISVFYRSYVKDKWLSEVINCNDTSSEGYAGISNKAISCLAVRADRGVVKYRVHTKNGKWLPFVTACNINSDSGYAGIKNKEIDGIQMEINGMPGYNILYRVSLVGDPKYLPWVTNWNNTNNGYAGVFGRSIDKVQIKIIKK